MNKGAWKNTGGDWSDGLGTGKLRNMERIAYVEPGAFLVPKILIALAAAIVTFLAWII